MGNLTEFMPQQSATVQAIYDAYKARGDAEPQRGYLGASIAGHGCDRVLWYTFRGVIREDKEGRIYRLLERGDLEESRLVADLRAIGCEVLDRDPATGEQFEVSDLGGHFSGHFDAAVLGVPEAPKAWHVGEFKTANAKHFAKIQKEGVRAAKPEHYAQMQLYMGQTGMDRALYLACNKDTDELYSERVKFDSAFYKRLMERVGRIIRASKPPERVASRSDDWRCKFCAGHALCWGSADKPAVPIPAQTCKSCCHSTPITEGTGARWRCERYDAEVDPEVGAECPTHLLLPGMVSFAEAVDAEDDWIEFKSRDGTTWRHGQGEGCWSTSELMRGRGPLDGPKPLPMARDPDPTPDSTPSTATGIEAAGAARTASRSDCLACGGDGVGPHPQVPCERCDGSGNEPGTATVLMGGARVAGPAEAADFAAGVEAARRSLLAVDLDDLPLIARYPWTESEKLWDGPASELENAMADRGLVPWAIGDPIREQRDENVNASEHHTEHGDYLIVHYKLEDHGAIWRGKA